MYNYRRMTTVAAPRETVFAFHKSPGALEKLMPPWANAEIKEHGGIEDGAQAVVLLKFGPLPFGVPWRLVHSDFIEGRQFRDTQVSGPFKSWQHTHSFLDDDGGACVIEDWIDFELPVPVDIAAKMIMHELNRMFDYREQVFNREFPNK